MAATFRIRSSEVSKTEVLQESAESPRPTVSYDDYLSRVVKLIPAEAVGLYLVGSGFIPEGEQVGLLIWTIFCFIAVLVIRIYGTADKRKDLPPQWGAVVVSVTAFIVWVYSIGGIFAQYGIHKGWVGSLAVLALTFVVPVLYKGSPE